MKIAITILTLALAMPLPAAASVVKLDLGDVTVNNNSRYALDVNSDGTSDLYVRDYFYTGGNPISGTRLTSYVRAYGDTGSKVTSGGAIAKRTLIDGSLSWANLNELTYKYYSFYSTISQRGNWLASNSEIRGFLGFSVTLADGTHYGWLDMTLYGTNVSVKLHSLGWENVAGVGINAGSSESLAIPSVPLPASAPLLMGALAGFGALRRRRRASA